ncbi:MAG: PD40 domain-containing protein [Gemmatimonadetes bacterium]|nr:PD40 domain-containing protein [Gemmatimonadota bacterium]
MTDPQARLASALAGRYRIERELGQGNVATVYLAHDVKHERKVAIKVLRPELAAVIGAERFLREIKTIATLQHPHILGLIDSGELEGTAYYVMPFVEGRVAARPPGPGEAAAGGGRGAARHRGGRRPRLRASPRDHPPRHQARERDAARRRRAGDRLRHRAGREQDGRDTDDRDGDEPRDTALHVAGTGHGGARDHGALRRVRARRHDLRDAGGGAALHRAHRAGHHRQGDDGRARQPHGAAEERAAGGGGGGVHRAREAAGGPLRERGGVRGGAPGGGRGGDARAPAAAPSASPVAARVLGAVAMVATLAALALAVKVWRPAPRPVTRLQLELPNLRVNHVGFYGTAFTLSPDGRRIAYVVGQGAEPTRIAVRELNSLQSRVLEGTEGGDGPFFSPDGHWIAFISRGKLLKVAVTGGAPSQLAEGASSVLAGARGSRTSGSSSRATPSASRSCRRAGGP